MAFAVHVDQWEHQRAGQFRVGGMWATKRWRSNLLITCGKEMVPEMELQEFLISMVGVVITAHQNKSQIANEMALVGARAFTVEETKRYAGSFNAPAGMVLGYAGATGDASVNSEKVFRYLC